MEILLHFDPAILADVTSNFDERTIDFLKLFDIKNSYYIYTIHIFLIRIFQYINISLMFQIHRLQDHPAKMRN